MATLIKVSPRASSIPLAETFASRSANHPPPLPRIGAQRGRERHDISLDLNRPCGDAPSRRAINSVRYISVRRARRERRDCAPSLRFICLRPICPVAYPQCAGRCFISSWNATRAKNTLARICPSALSPVIRNRDLTDFPRVFPSHKIFRVVCKISLFTTRPLCAEPRCNIREFYTGCVAQPSALVRGIGCLDLAPTLWGIDQQ